MKFLFYDNGSTGHHGGYIAGVVAAAQRSEADFLIGAVERPAPLTEDQRWIPVHPAPLRQVRDNRRQLAECTATARDRGADILVDLYLDKQIWTTGANQLPASVHVLHHAEQYGPRRGMAGLRSMYLRRRLSALTRQRATVVVHNDHTKNLISGFVDPARILIAGYPLQPLPGRGHRPDNDPPTLLFAGAGREEKGLDILVAALDSLAAGVKLRVVGRQPDGLEEQITQRFPAVPIEWVNQFVSHDQLVEEYLGADLAVLPYRQMFGDHGGPSSVLLETVSAAVPVVTTPALANQLPSDYPGAVVASADSAPAIAAAIATALNSLESMDEGARRVGPRFVADHHSFDAYLRQIERAAKLARG